MPQVTFTTTGGEQHTIACPGVDPDAIDGAFIEQRTAFSVQDYEVELNAEERVEQLEQRVDTLEG